MFGPGLITCAQYTPKMMHTNNTHANGCDYYKMADFDFISKDGMLSGPHGQGSGTSSCPITIGFLAFSDID